MLGFRVNGLGFKGLGFRDVRILGLEFPRNGSCPCKPYILSSIMRTTEDTLNSN